MSNIKGVRIEGKMPFDITEDDKARSWLGMLNGPSIGLRIIYGGTSTIENEHGGRTTMYEFEISGEEAIRFEALQTMVRELDEAGARIYQAYAQDIEDVPSLPVDLCQA